jgi:NTE family protein
MRSRPDVLVLGAGGVLGEAWMMGVLSGIEDATGFDMRHCEHFLGTSAGAIVCAHLAAGLPPDRPAERGATPERAAPPERVAPAERPEAGGELLRLASQTIARAAIPFAPAALSGLAPAGALLRAMMLAAVRDGTEDLAGLHRRVEGWGSRFDGRLRVVTVQKSSGRRVVFGSPGAPAASVAQAVVASCSIPSVFAPTRIGGRDYVDGAVWSLTNLDVAPALRDTHLLVLNPTAAIPIADRARAALRVASRSPLAVEALALRRRGAVVHSVGPDPASAEAMGPDFMERSRRRAVLAAGYAQGSELGRGRRNIRPLVDRARARRYDW